jgi:hypothetical protein
MFAIEQISYLLTAPMQDEGLNEPQQDGPKRRPQRQRKKWPCDWWVATKEVERATIF